MAQQSIDYGTIDNDGTGDTIRVFAKKCDDNFDELYARTPNATHTGDATGSGALTLATVNTDVGTYTAATITVNGKGLITAASSGTGSVVNKYSGTVNLAAASVTQKVCTGVTTEPYSILLLDSSDIVITSSVSIELTTVGGEYALNIYSVDAQNNVKVKILY
jgi:hypothetical protein